MAERRGIPSIDQLRRRSSIRALESRFGGSAVVDALREGTAAVRESIACGDRALSADGAIVARIESVAAAWLEEQFQPSLGPAINATGVIVHTNLGRAPLAAAAVEGVVRVSRGYSTLEYDLAQGSRGRRDVHAEALLCRLTGADAAVVVNNNAAATMLVLAALARGREVIVSRGELVEIGGGFRVPDVLAQSGATLREVGTTNKTRAADYALAIGDRTGLILRVHPSNFRIEGFTERPSLGDLVDLGRRFGVPVAEDLGSGYLAGSKETGPTHLADPLAQSEPAVEASVAAGADICCFSGDKLLGGPQAGIIVGGREMIGRIRRHPLMRALRVDKMTYAALEATLLEYAAGRAGTTVPVRRMLTMTADQIRARAETLAAGLAAVAGWRVDLLSGRSAVGGGGAPGVELPTWLLAIKRDGSSADPLAQRLRRLSPPVIARIEHDQVLLDLRTVLPDEDQQLLELLRRL
jgi:L-seryl-tRNA(Ser) seleniumtransferase